ncbi:hypothetical protein ACH5RR_025425 [Cinchona calisaya]|uniref:Exopolyphosphatase n=1 Tax=Cinchona calisaya TaxID=153742 RepID=A0ABD2Z0P9_9GENT
MEKRFNRNLSNNSRGSISLQKQVLENRRNRNENVPDLTDFMNDMFFGTASTDKKEYNLTGSEGLNEDSDSFDSSRRSVSSRSTQEWLEEAKRMVAQSPARCESPSRLAGSPRFATAQSTTSLDKRDPLSRSARRHRSLEGFSGEILSKSAAHTRNKSQANLDPTSAEESPASAVQKWFSNILKPQNNSTINPNLTMPSHDSPPNSIDNLEAPPLPTRQITPRKSRFQKNTHASQPHLIPPPTNQQPSPKRTFKNPANINTSAPNSPTILDNQLLSPPKHLVESVHRRSISSSTCSVPKIPVLSPPRNLAESAQRKSVSTFSNDRPLPRDNLIEHFRTEESRNQEFNGFLKEQRANMEKIMNGEVNRKAKIVLSGPTNSTSSMVAAICYAWLLENRMSNKNGRGREAINGELVVPVMNMRREKMWKQRQAAWLFHHVGIDVSALLFSDEVDLETLMMTRKLSILIVGQEILNTNGEVASGCTILTDNYCEDAYDLLQTPMLKKLLLAGILLDTQNLNASMKLSMTRDSEAIQLLLVGSIPSYRNTLFDQLMQDQRDDGFSEVLQKNYGKPSSESNSSKGPTPEHRVSGKTSDQGGVTPDADKSPKDTKYAKANTVSPKPGKPAPTPTKSPAAPSANAADSSRRKNTFFLAKWFGFGSK